MIKVLGWWRSRKSHEERKAARRAARSISENADTP
jgi:hypothetical protein